MLDSLPPTCHLANLCLSAGTELSSVCIAARISYHRILEWPTSDARLQYAHHYYISQDWPLHKGHLKITLRPPVGQIGQAEWLAAKPINLIGTFWPHGFVGNPTSVRPGFPARLDGLWDTAEDLRASGESLLGMSPRLSFTGVGSCPCSDGISKKTASHAPRS